MKGMKEERRGAMMAMVLLALLCCSGIAAEEKQTKAEITGRAAEDYSYNEFSFCLLPSDMPAPYTSFSASLTFTFSTPPQSCDISFLQMDESNTIFLGQFLEIDQENQQTTVVLTIHDSDLDYFGFNSQIFTDFEFVVGNLRTPAQLLTVSLSLHSPSFVPGLANGCPNTADLPFQLLPYFPTTAAEDSESAIVENNLYADSTHNDRNDDTTVTSTSAQTPRNYDMVLVLTILFVILIVISCASSAYVIAASIRNDPSRNRNNRRGEEVAHPSNRDVPEREFLV